MRRTGLSTREEQLICADRVLVQRATGTPGLIRSPPSSISMPTLQCSSGVVAAWTYSQGCDGALEELLSLLEKVSIIERGRIIEVCKLGILYDEKGDHTSVDIIALVAIIYMEVEGKEGGTR